MSNAYEFVSLHYTGKDVMDAVRLRLPSSNIVSLQVHGYGPDGHYYSIGLSGGKNGLGNFAVIHSSTKDKTQFFDELVAEMEKLYGRKAAIWTYALNEHRQTAFIARSSPAVITDLVTLDKHLSDRRRRIALEDLTFELFFDDLTRVPEARLSGKVTTRRYRTETHDGYREMVNGKLVVHPNFGTRSYVDG